MLDPFLRAGDIIAKLAAFALRRVSQQCILGIALVYNNGLAVQDPASICFLLSFLVVGTRTDGKRILAK